MSLSAVAVAGLEQAFNQYLNLDSKARSQMASLHGKVIAFELAGLGQTLYLIPGPAGVQLFSRCEDEPDCTLRGTLWPWPAWATSRPALTNSSPVMW